MSIPLRAAACGAVGVALTLTPGVADAASAERADSAQVHAGQTATGVRAERSRMRAGMHSRRSRAEVHAKMLAALQRAVRKQRAQMIAQWDRRADRAVRHALKQLGRPYVWGGTGPNGFDCSGLMQQAWKQAGVTVPRVSYDQYRKVRTHIARKNLRPGDLVFFNKLGHVGMYVGDQHFVHAPRPGRTVTLEKLRGYYDTGFVGASRPGWKPLPEVPTELW
ncbi:C40 family peptidase [Actinomadura hibisca]|uniref:C40 family peptidase n=1 Tax=Actinomadura hibisca TaxID=68565 RepID=UPI000835BA0B|nr:C40 family peptidase [Actinomadura hibisca]